MEFEHEAAGVLLRQWDVDPLLKSDKLSVVYSEQRRPKTFLKQLSPKTTLPSPDGGIKGPWDVCRPKYQHSIVVNTNTCETKKYWVNRRLNIIPRRIHQYENTGPKLIPIFKMRIWPINNIDTPLSYRNREIHCIRGKTETNFYNFKTRPSKDSGLVA